MDYVRGELTGIAGLDEVTNGLSPRGLTLILGGLGSGKTILSMQIAAHAAREGRNVIYLSAFSESHEKLIEHMRPFSFFDEALFGTGIEMLSLKSLLDEDADKMVRAIFTAARTSRHPLLILDGYRGLHAVIGAKSAQRFLASLASQLPYYGASCLVAAEFATPDFRDYPELTISDGIIQLWRVQHGAGRYRMLEVTKLRGHAFREGAHGMAIAREGIVVYPRLASMLPREEPEQPYGRQRFDLPELDAMLSGGLPTLSTTTVSGEPGTGKTTLALQYMVAGAAIDEPGLFVTFREPVADLMRKTSDLGIGLASALKAELVRILRLSPIESHPDELACRIVEEVRQYGIKRLVIDGVTELERAASVLGAESDYLAALLDYLHRAGTTTVIIRDRGGSSRVNTSVMPVASNRILLQRVRYQTHWHRVISILNMQASDHDTSFREFRIGTGGIRILSIADTGPGILTGVAVEQPTHGIED